MLPSFESMSVGHVPVHVFETKLSIKNEMKKISKQTKILVAPSKYYSLFRSFVSCNIKIDFGVG